MKMEEKTYILIVFYILNVIFFSEVKNFIKNIANIILEC